MNTFNGDYGPKYYDIDGNQITMDEWISLYEDNDQRIVARTELPGGCLVSTVHLGLDHNFSDLGPPLIFESMVFESRENLSDLYCQRYATKEQALAGHEELVTRWTGWTPGEPEPEEDQ